MKTLAAASAGRSLLFDLLYDIFVLMWLYMALLHGTLPYIQIVLSALIMVAVLLQRTGASLGGAFGADNFSSGFHTRRGMERFLFRATIVLAIMFALSALVNLVI